MKGGQNYWLLAMDMAKVGGPLSVVKVFTQIWTSHVHSILLQSSANFLGYSSSSSSYTYYIYTHIFIYNNILEYNINGVRKPL